MRKIELRMIAPLEMDLESASTEHVVAITGNRKAIVRRQWMSPA